MNLIPFGEVKKDRYDISVKYGLIEKVGGIWRLTAKCKENYDLEKYVYYLRGGAEPERISKPTKMTVKEELKSPEVQKVIDEILEM
jgi:hypothetical protein